MLLSSGDNFWRPKKASFVADGCTERFRGEFDGKFHFVRTSTDHTNAIRARKRADWRLRSQSQMTWHGCNDFPFFCQIPFKIKIVKGNNTIPNANTKRPARL